MSRSVRAVCCVHTRGRARACIGRVSEITLVEQRAQIDQVVRVEVGGAAGLAFDEVAQVARIGPRLHLEVREEHAEAIAFAQLPAGRRRMRQAATRDGGLLLCSRCPRRPPCRLSHREHRWMKRVRGLELIRQEVRVLNIFREHTHLEDKAEEEDHHEREVAKQAELNVAVVLEGLGN
eukprot:scaffold7496_cov59-Phaeocystis_antarctica.AAC.2